MFMHATHNTTPCNVCKNVINYSEFYNYHNMNAPDLYALQKAEMVLEHDNVAHGELSTFE